MKHFVFALVLIFFIYLPPDKPHGDSSKTKQDSNSCTASPVNMVCNQTRSDGQKNRGDESPNGNTPLGANWEALGTWGLVIVGVLTLIGIFKQVKESANATKAVRDSIPYQKMSAEAAKTSAEAAQKAGDVAFRNIEAFKSKERARLTIRTSYKDGLNGFEEDDEAAIYFASPNYPQAGIEILQKGPTMASNVAGRFTLMSSSNRAPIPILNPNTVRINIPTEIEGNTEESCLVTITLAGCDTEAVKQEKLFIHFFGSITYVDIFNDPHFIRFRYIWIPTQYEIEIGGGGEVIGPDLDRVAEEGHWAQHGPPEDNQAT
jgi:hypothetical protein